MKIQNKIIIKFFLPIFILCMHAVSIAMDTIEHSQLKFIPEDFNFHDNYTATVINVYDQNKMRIGHIEYFLDLHEKIGNINTLEIEIEQQKKGIGSKLFLMALHDAKKKEISAIEWISTKNALPFYERFGSKKVDSSYSIIGAELYFPDMEFVFKRDGDPEENLKNYYANKAI